MKREQVGRPTSSKKQKTNKVLKIIFAKWWSQKCSSPCLWSSLEEMSSKRWRSLGLRRSSFSCPSPWVWKGNTQFFFLDSHWEHVEVEENMNFYLGFALALNNPATQWAMAFFITEHCWELLQSLLTLKNPYYNTVLSKTKESKWSQGDFLACKVCCRFLVDFL